MDDIIVLDVQGLSCPEPVMMVMEAMDTYPGKTIRVIADEAHTRTNIEKTLKYQKKQGTTVEKDGKYEITFTA